MKTLKILIFLAPYIFATVIAQKKDFLIKKDCVDGATKSGAIYVNSEKNFVPPISYKLNNGKYQSSPLFTGLNNGLYNVTVKGKNGAWLRKSTVIDCVNISIASEQIDVPVTIDINLPFFDRVAYVPVLITPSGQYNVSIKNEIGVEIYAGSNPVTFGSSYVNLQYTSPCDGIARNYIVSCSKVNSTRVVTGQFVDLCSTNSTSTMTKVNNYNFTLEDYYNSSFNPNTKYGQFQVNGSPFIYDAGHSGIGNYFNQNFSPIKSGFTHATLRSYQIIGNSIQNAINESKFNSLPKSNKAFEQNADADVFYTSESGETMPNWAQDATCLCSGNSCTQNPFIKDLSTLNSLLTQYQEADLVSFDTEHYYTFPDDSWILSKRNCLEGGKYKSSANGGTSPTYSIMSDSDWIIEYKKNWVDYWRYYTGILQTKCNSTKMAWYGAGSKIGASGLSTFYESNLFSGNIEWWWNYQGSSSFKLKDNLTYQGGFDTYIGEHSSPIDPSDKQHILNLLSVCEALRYSDPNTKRLVHFKPFRENIQGQVSGNCTACSYASASKSVAQGMVYSLFFTGTGGWLWGTSFMSEFGNAIEYVIEARKVCSDLNSFITGSEKYIIPEISTDGGTTWIGDSNNWPNSINPSNPSRYNVFTSQNSSGSIPIVRGIVNGKDLAIFCTTSGATSSQNIKIRVKNLSGGYFTSNLTVNSNCDVYKKINAL